jgi:hypothetical protein
MATLILAVPRVRLLGAPAVLDAAGPAPATVGATGHLTASHTGRVTELIAYLACHPDGVTTGELAAAMSPHRLRVPGTFQALVSRARAWLGNTDGGEPYLPRVTSGGIYRLHPELCSDWSEFLDLVPHVYGVATGRLHAAIELVEGQPFFGTPVGRWAWAEPVRQRMISTIGGACHELAQRYLDCGDVAGARYAAAQGRIVDPGDEALWRDALRAERAAGDIDGQRRVVDGLSHLQLGDLEPETLRLLNG